MLIDTTADHLQVITDATGIWVTVDGLEYQVSTETDAKSAYGMMTESEYRHWLCHTQWHRKTCRRSSYTSSSFMEFELTSDYTLEEVVIYPFTDTDGDKIFVSFLAYECDPQYGL